MYQGNLNHCIFSHNIIIALHIIIKHIFERPNIFILIFNICFFSGILTKFEIKILNSPSLFKINNQLSQFNMCFLLFLQISACNNLEYVIYYCYSYTEIAIKLKFVDIINFKTYSKNLQLLESKISYILFILLNILLLNFSCVIKSIFRSHMNCNVFSYL